MTPYDVASNICQALLDGAVRAHRAYRAGEGSEIRVARG